MNKVVSSPNEFLGGPPRSKTIGFKDLSIDVNETNKEKFENHKNDIIQFVKENVSRGKKINDLESLKTHLSDEFNIAKEYIIPLFNDCIDDNSKSRQVVNELIFLENISDIVSDMTGIKDHFSMMKYFESTEKKLELSKKSLEGLLNKPLFDYFVDGEKDRRLIKKLGEVQVQFLSSNEKKFKHLSELTYHHIKYIWDQTKNLNEKHKIYSFEQRGQELTVPLQFSLYGTLSFCKLSTYELKLLPTSIDQDVKRDMDELLLILFKIIIQSSNFFLTKQNSRLYEFDYYLKNNNRVFITFATAIDGSFNEYPITLGVDSGKNYTYNFSDNFLFYPDRRSFFSLIALYGRPFSTSKFIKKFILEDELDARLNGRENQVSYINCEGQTVSITAAVDACPENAYVINKFFDIIKDIKEKNGSHEMFIKNKLGSIVSNLLVKELHQFLTKISSANDSVFNITKMGEYHLIMERFKGLMIKIYMGKILKVQELVDQFEDIFNEMQDEKTKDSETNLKFRKYFHKFIPDVMKFFVMHRLVRYKYFGSSQVNDLINSFQIEERDNDLYVSSFNKSIKKLWFKYIDKHDPEDDNNLTTDLQNIKDNDHEGLLTQIKDKFLNQLIVIFNNDSPVFSLDILHYLKIIFQVNEFTPKEKKAYDALKPPSKKVFDYLLGNGVNFQNDFQIKSVIKQGFNGQSYKDILRILAHEDFDVFSENIKLFADKESKKIREGVDSKDILQELIGLEISDDFQNEIQNKLKGTFSKSLNCGKDEDERLKRLLCLFGFELQYSSNIYILKPSFVKKLKTLTYAFKALHSISWVNQRKNEWRYLEQRRISVKGDINDLSPLLLTSLGIGFQNHDIYMKTPEENWVPQQHLFDMYMGLDTIEDFYLTLNKIIKPVSDVLDYFLSYIVQDFNSSETSYSLNKAKIDKALRLIEKISYGKISNDSSILNKYVCRKWLVQFQSKINSLFVVNNSVKKKSIMLDRFSRLLSSPIVEDYDNFEKVKYFLYRMDSDKNEGVSLIEYFEGKQFRTLSEYKDGLDIKKMFDKIGTITFISDLESEGSSFNFYQDSFQIRHINFLLPVFDSDNFFNFKNFFKHQRDFIDPIDIFKDFHKFESVLFNLNLHEDKRVFLFKNDEDKEFQIPLKFIDFVLNAFKFNDRPMGQYYLLAKLNKFIEDADLKHQVEKKLESLKKLLEPRLFHHLFDFPDCCSNESLGDQYDGKSSPFKENLKVDLNIDKFGQKSDKQPSEEQFTSFFDSQIKIDDEVERLRKLGKDIGDKLTFYLMEEELRIPLIVFENILTNSNFSYQPVLSMCLILQSYMCLKSYKESNYKEELEKLEQKIITIHKQLFHNLPVKLQNLLKGVKTINPDSLDEIKKPKVIEMQKKLLDECQKYIKDEIIDFNDIDNINFNNLYRLSLNEKQYFDFLWDKDQFRSNKNSDISIPKQFLDLIVENDNFCDSEISALLNQYYLLIYVLKILKFDEHWTFHSSANDDVLDSKKYADKIKSIFNNLQRYLQEKFYINASSINSDERESFESTKSSENKIDCSSKSSDETLFSELKQFYESEEIKLSDKIKGNLEESMKKYVCEKISKKVSHFFKKREILNDDNIANEIFLKSPKICKIKKSDNKNDFIFQDQYLSIIPFSASSILNGFASRITDDQSVTYQQFLQIIYDLMNKIREDYHEHTYIFTKNRKNINECFDNILILIKGNDKFREHLKDLQETNSDILNYLKNIIYKIFTFCVINKVEVVDNFFHGVFQKLFEAINEKLVNGLSEDEFKKYVEEYSKEFFENLKTTEPKLIDAKEIKNEQYYVCGSDYVNGILDFIYEKLGISSIITCSEPDVDPEPGFDFFDIFDLDDGTPKSTVSSDEEISRLHDDRIQLRKVTSSLSTTNSPIRQLKKRLSGRDTPKRQTSSVDLTLFQLAGWANSPPGSPVPSNFFETIGCPIDSPEDFKNTSYSNSLLGPRTPPRSASNSSMSNKNYPRSAVNDLMNKYGTPNSITKTISDMSNRGASSAVTKSPSLPPPLPDFNQVYDEDTD